MNQTLEQFNINILILVPSVVLRVEEEVGADDGDADGDDGQDDEDEEHEAVDVVDLVGPERGEDEIPGGKKERIYSKVSFVQY